VDLNCGCAVKKILKSGSGVSLMQDPPRAAAMFKALRAAIKIPLTIKLRAGWDSSGDQALALGRLAQDCGVDAVALHPRTARQGFGGKADWSLIARLKAVLSIPVIGNGDIVSADDHGGTGRRGQPLHLLPDPRLSCRSTGAFGHR
jgi:tRNA-dihydrouridine synthase